MEAELRLLRELEKDELPEKSRDGSPATIFEHIGGAAARKKYKEASHITVGSLRKGVNYHGIRFFRYYP